MNAITRRRFYLNPADWSWWAWTITTVLLLAGLAGDDFAILVAMAVTAVQGIILLIRDRSLTAFSVQIRVAYLLLMLMSYPDPMRWFYWLLIMGTLGLIVFGYCMMARMLSLLPWNSREAYTLDRLRRTFLSAPDPDRVTNVGASPGRVGGLCTIEAQVAPRSL